MQSVMIQARKAESQTLLKVWILPTIHGGHQRGSDWLSLLLLGQNTGDCGIYGQRGLFSTQFWRAEIQDRSATCGKSLTFHFNMWTNKRTVTLRTERARSGLTLQKPALSVTNSVPVRKRCQRRLLPSFRPFSRAAAGG